MRPFLAKTASGLLLVAALLLLPQPAWATTHTANTFPPISAGYPQTAHTAFGAGSVQNLMMYDVTVAVTDTYNDSSHDAVIGFMTQTDYAGAGCAASTLWNYSPTARFQTTFTSRKWTLYNFQPNVAYEYVVRLGPKTDGSYSYTCGSLGTPTLPTDLGYLNLMVNQRSGIASDYVMFDTDDCAGSVGNPTGGKQYLVLVDTRSTSEKIVWYLDIPAVSTSGGTGLTGWRYQTGDSAPSTNRILGTVDHGFLYEWGWDGSVIDYRALTSTNCDGSASGPCYSHDAFKSDDTDKTYVVSQKESSVGKLGTAWGTACPMVNGRFVDDGYQESDGALATVNDELFLMADVGYDPTTATDGFNAPTACTNTYWTGYFNSTYSPFDWMHVNSIAASDVGGDEVVDLSLRAWDQIIRINTATSATWTLSPHTGYTDPTLGKAGGITGDTYFQGQHDVHPPASGQLMMLDNQGDSSGASRVLRILLGAGAPPSSATIQKSWSLVDDSMNPLYCPAQGSAEVVEGTSGANVLAMCNEEHTIVETNDSDGVANTAPLLAIWLPVTSPRTFCTNATHGPPNIDNITGWFRAFPVETVGEF